MSKDDFWSKISSSFDEELNKRKKQILAEKKAKAKKIENERFRKEADECQKSFMDKWSNTTSKNSSLNEGDASSLYNKFNNENFSAYKDEIFSRYGAHNDGYSNKNVGSSLNRGLGASSTTQTIKRNDKINNHRFDASAPKIRVRLQNSWGAAQGSNSQTLNSTSNNSGRAQNGGRISGGSSLKGRF